MSKSYRDNLPISAREFVDQLLRYQERLDRDPQYAPTVGMFVAQQIKPQAKVYAESKGVAWLEIDLDLLRGGVDPDLKLF